VCRQLSVTWNIASCTTETGIRTADIDASENILEALSARSTRPSAVQKAVVVHYGICVLSGDGAIACVVPSPSSWARRTSSSNP
jgi:hypothetical protein